MNNIKEIIWDFDGVILLSDAVREYGFRKVFEAHPEEQVEQLVQFHLKNGGLSRYVKIRYFYENILNQPISEEEVMQLADNFSVIMREALVNVNLLNPEWLELMKQIGKNYVHSIASGSDGNELNYLCRALGIADHFKIISGSPTPKKQLVADIIDASAFSKEEIVLIGDAINDLEAAEFNQIQFIGYNHHSLKDTPFFLTDLTKAAQILSRN
ncbi:haloacid dehalogenase [Flavobacterium magnum]|uniref:phosphoglycolate phosphatase n=1 Tax=Flavobacterium magnum TaxID=2162713 RepID=A0A2S0RAN3_9FLAO|nr:HAD family hydrolase [Flavobacterium magnum]AWA28639.1 haloacid dehalogenase [Flavobacterium magnum]